MLSDENVTALRELQAKIDSEVAAKEEKTVTVRWHACSCDWATKYCDEFHTAYAKVPVSVLERYKV